MYSGNTAVQAVVALYTVPCMLYSLYSRVGPYSVYAVLLYSLYSVYSGSTAVALVLYSLYSVYTAMQQHSCWNGSCTTVKVAILRITVLESGPWDVSLTGLHSVILRITVLEMAHLGPPGPGQGSQNHDHFGCPKRDHFLGPLQYKTPTKVAILAPKREVLFDRFWPVGLSRMGSQKPRFMSKINEKRPK